MMDTLTTNLPIFIVIAPLFLAFILPTISRKIRLVEVSVFVVGFLFAVGTIWLSFMLINQNGVPIIYELGGWSAPWGIELKVGNLGDRKSVV